MSFLTPKVNIPPPAPPPPPPPAAPAPVVKAGTSEVEKTKKKNKGKATMKTSQVTGSQGVTTDAPIEYKSLLGGK
tara:strand:- start:48 stop:272 length:225 start_codon:yes stop_codon:yes gene_type:complete